MNRQFSTSLRRILKVKPASKPRRPTRPAVEPLEAREVPVVGAFAFAPQVLRGEGFDGVVSLLNSEHSATGTLLSTGRHVLTAAHVLTNGNGKIDNPATTVTFELPSGDLTIKVPRENYRIHPKWNGDLAKGNDLAILELPVLAPIGAERFDIFRGSNEVGNVMTLVGYGQTGTGATGAQEGTGGTKRKGINLFTDATAKKLEFFFDTTGHAFVAHGDSGGPNLLAGRIAGVNSYGDEKDPLRLLPEFEFGEWAFSTRVSAFAGWIDAQTSTMGKPLTFDMSCQPFGNDGRVDSIEIRIINGNLEIRVHDDLHGFDLVHTEAAANVAYLEILGSSDTEQVVVTGPLTMNATLSPGASTSATPQSLLIQGTRNVDKLTLASTHLTFGGKITFGGFRMLDIATFGGNDVITVESVPAFTTVQVDGGANPPTLADSDTLVGPNAGNVWNVTSLNAGDLNSSVKFVNVENLRGGAAADTFRFTDEGSVSGSVDGGISLGRIAPIDTLDYGLRKSAVVVDLTRRLVPGVKNLVNVKQVIGTPKDDYLRGDARDNLLVGGGGFDILVGEAGNDRLTCGPLGRCILIGGSGKDVLVGGDPSPLSAKLPDGGDLLIAGRTVFDGDRQALTAIMTEWRRTDRTYEQRVQALRDGVAVSGGGVVQLTTATVLSDREVDQLAGKKGDDWFWGLLAEVIDRSELISKPGVLEFVN